MKTCPECGYKMQKDMKECPECGHEMIQNKKKNKSNFDSADNGSTADDLDNGTNNGETLMKMTVDGISMEINDKDAQIIQRALDTQTAKIKELGDKSTQDAATITKLTTDAASLQAQIANKDAEIVTLKQAVTDAAVTPQKLDELVKDRGDVITKAKSMIGDKLVVDGKSISEIKRQVVDARLGDNAKGFSDEQINTAFTTLEATTVGDGVRRMATAFDHKPQQHTAQATAMNDVYKKENERLQNAWMGDKKSA